MNFFKDFFTPTTPSQTSTAPSQAPSDTTQRPLGSSPPLDKNGKPDSPSETPVNPLDTYAKMFENAAKSHTAEAPNFKIDPKVLSEVSSSMDFTKSVDPNLMEQALQGDYKALLAVMKTVGQNAYSASLEHATALTEKYLSQRADYESQKINSGVRQQLTSNALSTAPNYNHPVIKTELNRIAAQFASANPDASPSEVAKAAQQYIADLAKALAPPQKETPKEGEQEMDWTKYLTS